MKWICSLALMLAVPLRVPAAQEPPALARGARVRVTTLVGSPGVRGLYDDRVVGTLESIDSASIVLRLQNGDTANLPRGRVTRMDVSAGPGSCSPGHRGRCVLVGFLVGAAVGAAIATVAYESSKNDAPAGAYQLMLMPPGALVGTIVGLLRGGEHWNRVELPVGLTLAPGRPGTLQPWRGVRVGVRLAF